MSLPSDARTRAARDIRAALALTHEGTERFRVDARGLTPDQAAEVFANDEAGPPARASRHDESAVLYPQIGKPSLLIGAYGSEPCTRAWLPGLPGNIAPGTTTVLQPLPAISCEAPDRETAAGLSLDHLPIPQVTPRDAGPYITMGFALARTPTGDLALSAHRMLVLGPRQLGVWMLASRHLRSLAQAAWDQNQALPLSINIGVPPAVAIAAATGTANLPSRFDKMSLAGALATAPIETTPGLAHHTETLSKAEIVIEGLLTARTTPETLGGRPLCHSMPEFLGYDGSAQPELAVFEVGHVHLRKKASFHATIGPGREQSVILGLGGALSIALGLDRVLGEAVHDLRFSHAGGGMLLLYAAIKPGLEPPLEPLARAMIAICPFIKTIIFVDSDVDLSCNEEVLWAMTTRAQLASDCYALPGYAAMPMDPSQSPEWMQSKGTVEFKSYVDATTPTALRAGNRRSFPAIA